MDVERVRFVTGGDVDAGAADEWDLTDQDSRQILYDELFGHLGDPLEVAARAVVANQVLDDEPAVTWQTVERLAAAGMDRDAIFDQLATVMLATLQAMMAKHQVFDAERFAAELARLPLPTIAAIEQEVLDATRANPGITVNSLRAAIRAAHGLVTDDRVGDSLVDHALDNLIHDGRVGVLAGDRAVPVRELLAGSALTLHISPTEADRGVHRASFDLAALARHGEVHLPLWLSELETDTDIVARLDADGTIVVEALDDIPPIDAALVQQVRQAYEREVVEGDLPVYAEDLLLSLLLEDRSIFATPQAPLGVLCQAAGLELRGDQVAHDESVWQHQDRVDRMWRVVNAAEDDERLWHRVGRIVDIGDLVSGQIAANLELGPVNDDLLRSALTDLEDIEALGIIASEMALPGIGQWGQPFIAGLLHAARKPRHTAIAHYLAARRAEGADDAPAAEQHLDLGYAADHNFTVGTDRLAWYASIRGDAAKAVRLWQQCPLIAVIADDLAVLEPLVGGTSAPDQADRPPAKLGRNDPCWCGSGRKFKQCHLGSFTAPPLPERISWLLRKAGGFVERTDAARESYAEVIYSRVEDMEDEDAVDDALEDPLLMDLVLTEDGWLERFLIATRALLPEDEADLLRSWLPIERTVYEAVAVRPGEGMTVRDLRTDEELDVRGAMFSRQVRAGMRFCARAVPDTVGHQFVGGIFTVPPGFEAALFELLDRKDALALAEFSAQPASAGVVTGEPGELHDHIDLREPDRAPRSRRP